MSLQFNDTATKRGIIQEIESNCGFQDGGISGNTTLLKKFTAQVNLALDKIFSIIFKAGKKWQFDDGNHIDHPFIMTNIVSGQRDYSFVTDEQGNLILDIYKVMRKNADGFWEEIKPVDQQSDETTEEFYDGRDVPGIPNRYDKTGNSIFFDVVPDYNSTNGLKIFINREGSYFVYGDTNKKPGFAGLFHEYLALRPSYFYAIRKGLKNYKLLKGEMLEMEGDCKKYYSDRSKDDADVLTAEGVDYI